MIGRIRQFGAAVLRWAGMRPPRGHMDMLRGVVDRHEEDRVSRDLKPKNRQAKDAIDREAP